MRRRLLLPALLLATLCCGAGASEAQETEWTRRLALPPLLPTRDVITALPQVQAARAGQDAARARSQALDSGAYEWNLRAGAQERREDAGGRYLENEVALERSIRWGGKAGTDRALGAAGQTAARAGYADSWHEAVRGLLVNWYDWQRARSAAAVQGQQLALAQEQLDVATRRVRAGDVPRMDALMAEAERDRVQAQLQRAQEQEQVLRHELQKRYPGLALDAGTVAAADSAPDALQLPGEPAQWVQRILDDNHEIERAEAALRLARLRSERAGLERQPDPLLGVRAARERGGAENIVGVYVGIPLTGSYRAAGERVALAELAAAEQELLLTRQRVETAAQRVVLRAGHARAAWQRLAAVAQAMTHVAQLGMKAYGLGEMTLSEALQARRAALEAVLAAEAARWDALEATGRVLVDAHQLWAAEEGPH